MPPLLAAMANAGRHGVLVKSAVVMEEAGATSLVAFDKTGTLTEGTPRLAEIRVLPGGGRDEREILELAAAAENPSEHPLGRAVVTAARDAALAPPTAAEFTALPGRGVSALVSGHRIEIGSPRHLARAATAATAAVAALEEDGQTAAVMSIDGIPAAVLGIADRLRPTAAGAVERITALTGASPVLLTGDNDRAARKLAGQTGIADVRAGLLPQDKVAAIREWQAPASRVLLAGDGVDDAPALAAASTGAAMGGTGSDLALDAADVVIMRDDLAVIPAVIGLSRRARAVVAANLCDRRRDHHRPCLLGPGRPPAAPPRRSRPRGLHRDRRAQRAAAPARQGLEPGAGIIITAGADLQPRRWLDDLGQAVDLAGVAAVAVEHDLVHAEVFELRDHRPDLAGGGEQALDHGFGPAGELVVAGDGRAGVVDHGGRPEGGVDLGDDAGRALAAVAAPAGANGVDQARRPRTGRRRRGNRRPSGRPARARRAGSRRTGPRGRRGGQARGRWGRPDRRRARRTTAGA